MTTHIGRVRSKHIALATLLLSLILSAFYALFHARLRDHRANFYVHWNQQLAPRPHPGNVYNTEDGSLHSLAVPSPNNAHLELDGLCGERLGLRYVQDFSATATNYCDKKSRDKLTCFHNRIQEKTDSFCIGTWASFDSDLARFDLECDLRPLHVDEATSETPSFDEFPLYWYGTGPRNIFSAYFNLGDRSGAVKRAHSNSGAETWILIQRENNNQNIWHTLMEIMSLSLSIQILTHSTDHDTGNAYWSARDLEKARMVFLDDLPEGPYYDLWAMFTGLQSIRLADLPSLDTNDARVILPLPGSANPFWQGQWADMRCGESPLLADFSHQVLDYYQVAKSAPRSERQLVLTIAHRTNSRRLINQDAYVAKLKSRHPKIRIQVVDFGSLDLSQQVEVAHNTDILAGPHGAGLTHAIFLPPNSAVVEISPPGTAIKTFDFVAQSLGHRYFQRFGNADYRNDNWTGDWQHDDIFLEESKFIALMEEAIKSTSV